MNNFIGITNAYLSFRSSGRQEIKRTLQKNLLYALAVSVGIHTVIIGSYYLQQFIGNDDDNVSTVTVRLMKYSELGPPPSIMNAEQLPAVGITAAITKPSIGIPVPVPDVEVNAEQTIATQQELSQIQSSVLVQEGTAGKLQVEQDVNIEEDPLPDAFIPVEKTPVIVKQVEPVYPEVARRTGIEGVVWVRVLVGKDGKVKKALIVKSNAEIFNEIALEAALQWVFTPAMMNAGPVSVWVAIPFHFRLSKISS
jgi:protein TonB